MKRRETEPTRWLKQERTHPLILLGLLALPVLLLVTSLVFGDDLVGERHQEKTPAVMFNQQLGEAFPFSQRLRQLGILVRYYTGETRQDGVYLSDKGLLKDIPPPDSIITQQNNQAVVRLAELSREWGGDRTVALLVLPSATAVIQQNLPRFSDPVNQRNLIENIYNQMVGKVTTVGTYNTLLDHRSQYLYYRTENRLTPLGGYYIYKEVMERLLAGEQITALVDFNVLYGQEYYGDLYEQVPFGLVQPDRLMYYFYRGKVFRSHRVTHQVGTTKMVYGTLYPKMGQPGIGLASYLGGGGGSTKIESSATHDLKLLVLGDGSALSYLPFLANHYGEILFVDLMDENQQLEGLKLDRYDQILLAVTAESYSSEAVFLPVVALAEEQWAVEAQWGVSP